MRKETMFAIVVGILFGLIGTGAIVFFSMSDEMKNQKPKTIKPTPTMQLIRKPTKELVVAFDIEYPTNNIIVKNKTIEFKGKAPSQSLILINTPQKIITHNTGNSENFSINVDLVFGENNIDITCYSPNSIEYQEKELRIFYLNQ